jgi:hypothetical protein
MPWQEKEEKQKIQGNGVPDLPSLLRKESNGHQPVFQSNGQQRKTNAHGPLYGRLVEIQE